MKCVLVWCALAACTPAKEPCQFDAIVQATANASAPAP
jgi:hypothetical protein